MRSAIFLGIIAVAWLVSVVDVCAGADTSNCEQLNASARKLVQNGDLLAAQALVDKCLEQDAENIEAHWNTAVILSKSDDKLGAIAMIKQVVLLDPRNVKFCVLASSALYFAGEYKEVMAVFDRYLQSHGFENWLDLHAHVHHLVLGEKRVLGVEFLEEHGSDAAQIGRYFVEAKIANEEYTAAYRAYELLLILNPGDEKVHRDFSLYATSMGQITEAIIHAQHGLGVHLVSQINSTGKQREHDLTQVSTYTRQVSLLSASLGIESMLVSLARSLFKYGQNEEIAKSFRLYCHVQLTGMYGPNYPFIWRGDVEEILLNCLTRQGTVKTLVDQGAMANLGSFFGHSSAHVFAGLGYAPLLEMILEQSVQSTNFQNTFGQTPLHIAAIHGRSSTVQTLLDLHADEGMVDNWGRTAWDCACAIGPYVSSAVAEAFGYSGPENCPKPAVGRHDENCPAPPATSKNGGWMTDERALGGDLNEDTCDIDVICASTTTAEDFIRDYLVLGKPVLIRGAAVSSEWLNGVARESLLVAYGSTPVQRVEIPYASNFGKRTTPTTIRQFIAYMRSAEVEVEQFPDYVFESLATSSPLINEFDRFMPEFLDPEVTNITARNAQFYLGPPGSGAPIHWHSSAWNALVYGRKRWFLFSPHDAFYSRKHIGQWILEDRPQLPNRRAPFECVQRRGDVVFVPDKWGHGVINLADSIGFASEFQWANTVLEV